MLNWLRFCLFVGVVSLAAALAHGYFGGIFLKVSKENAMALSVESAFRLEDVLWLDARSEVAYNRQHLEGALLLNEDNWEWGVEALLQVWDLNQPLIIYCDGGGCAASRHVAQRLREEFGVEAVYWLVDGWDALKLAGRVSE